MDTKKNSRFIIASILSSLFFSCIVSFIISFVCFKRQNSNVDLYSDNINKIVEIAAYDDENNKSYGTAWFINDSTLVTNYHVLSYLDSGERIKFNSIEIRFWNEEKYESVDILKYDEPSDIAFLNYNGTREHSYFSICENIEEAEKCYSIGNFQNYGLSYKEGYISLLAVNLQYNNHYAEYIQCSMTIGQGDSGAPVFDSNNKVFGMITFRTKASSGNVEQGFCYAIPVKDILAVQ